MPKQKQNKDWTEREIENEVKKTAEHIGVISEGAIQTLVDRVRLEEYRKGYNQCLKDNKIPNKYGEKSL